MFYNVIIYEIFSDGGLHLSLNNLPIKVKHFIFNSYLSELNYKIIILLLESLEIYKINEIASFSEELTSLGCFCTLAEGEQPLTLTTLKREYELNTIY